jgi:signal transduction histidine kinase
MYAELLEQGRVGTEERRRTFFGIIRQEAERLTRLIDQVLDLTRWQRREEVGATGSIDVLAVIEGVWAIVRERLEAEGFEHRLVITTTGRYELRADADAITRMLTNLFENAIRYSTTRKEVMLEARACGHELVVSVLDRGRGVASANRARIFEPFFQEHGAEGGESGGIGLGLSLTVQLANSLGGSVTYEPRDGGGSVFSVHLPGIVGTS